MLLNSELQARLEQAFTDYHGDVRVVETAIGAIFVGQIMGWRALRVMHGASTIKKYECILGMKFSEVCPERGPQSQRSRALRVADACRNYWGVVCGHVQGRGPELDKSETQLDWIERSEKIIT